MAKRTNKPTPKSQKEISNSLIQPYVNPETGETLGNPNPSNFDQFNDREQAGVDKNRSENLSFRNDTTKPFTVGIKDIDEAIMYYFTEIIKPTIFQNGNKIKVPVIYGSPERWKSTQIDGYYKDKNGKIMAPLIMFKKESITNDLSKSSKVDANYPHLYTSWQKSYSNKNSYSNFNILNNSIPTKQFVANVVPDYVTLTYKCTIQAYYVEQLNKIIEAINYASNSYWGFPERFKFKSMIDSYTVATELNQGTDRIVKGDFTLKVMGYIVPDTIQKGMNSIKKYNSKSQIVIGIEMTSSPMETSTITSTKPNNSTIFPSTPSSGGNTPINNEVIIYLNTNIQKTGTYVNSTTITFNSGWLASPTGLPATTINNFTIFCNGVLIEKTAIISFTELSGTTTLIINPSELGYEFSISDEVIAIGKFLN